MSFLEKKLSLRTDFLITVLNGVGTVAGIFFVTGYLARSLGLDALGEYLLVRRSVTAMLGVLLLGMNVALPTLLSRDHDKGYGDVASLIFIIGTIPFVFLIIVVVTVFGSGNIDLSRALPYFFYAIGFCSLTMAYALYRGHMNMIGANLLQLIAGTAVSLIAVVLATSVESLLLMIAFPMIILSIMTFIHRNRGISLNRVSKKALKELISFGSIRIPSFIFQFVLLAGIPLLAVPYLGLSDQAFLNALISLVRIFLIVVGPLGIVLLPRISQAVSKDMRNHLRKNLVILIQVSIFYGLIAAIVLIKLSQEILILWLGEVTELAANAANVILISVPFLVLSGVLRSPIDAGHARGFNSTIYGIGAVVMAVSFFYMLFMDYPPFSAAVLAFLMGHTACGIGSFVVARNLFGIKVFKIRFIISMIIASLFILGLSEVLTFYIGGGMIYLIVSLISVGTICILHLFLSKESWIVAFRKALFA